MAAVFKITAAGTDVCSMSPTADDAPDLPAPTLPQPSLPDPGAARSGPHAVATVPTAPTLSLDGELPRLGTATLTAPPPESDAPLVGAGPTGTAGLALPSLPTAPSVAPSQPGTAHPSAAPAGLDVAGLPTLPSAPPARTEATESAPEGGPATTVDHPMAHMMPPKASPSEASRKAAEIRAAKKAKGRKVKIGVAVGAIVIAVVVGPPLFRWFGNAINEAGSTSTEQPAD